MKKIVSVVLAILLFACLTSTAFAADPPVKYSSVPTEGTPAKGNIGSAEGVVSYAAASNPLDIHIYTWRNSIEEYSSAYLKLFALTETDWLPDKIETDYYLQQWNGTTWVTYSTSFNWKYENDYLALSIYRYVAHGYYYRLKTVHMGWLDGTYDERTLYSSYIYVS